MFQYVSPETELHRLHALRTSSVESERDRAGSMVRLGESLCSAAGAGQVGMNEWNDNTIERESYVR